MYSRRLFLGAAATSVGLAACGGASGPKMATRKLDKLGLQTYSLREIFEPDPVGTLKMLKELGYDYVELNGRNFAERSTEDLINMVKDAGLYAPSTHYGIEVMRDDFSQTVKDAQSLGVEYMIAPWMDESERTIEGYKANACLLYTSPSPRDRG